MGDIEKVKIQISKGTCPSNDSSISQLDQLEDQLNTILDFETRGLIIRSRIRWMEEGEKSSKYFCNLEKRSSERKNIQRIKNDCDSLIHDSSDIMNDIYSFYQNLYSDQNNGQTGCNFEEFLDSIDIPKLDDDYKQLFEHPISKQEL